MSDQPIIRALTIEDLPQCETNFPSPSFISYRQQIARQSDRGYSLYGCFVDGQLAGLMHVNRHGAKDSYIQQSYPHPVLGNLVVNTNYRQRGVAKTLLKHCENTLRSEGYKAAGLIVSADNQPAINLYEKTNFQPIEQLPPRTSIGNQPRIYFQKSLHSPDQLEK